MLKTEIGCMGFMKIIKYVCIPFAHSIQSVCQEANSLFARGWRVLLTWVNGIVKSAHLISKPLPNRNTHPEIDFRVEVFFVIIEVLACTREKLCSPLVIYSVNFRMIRGALLLNKSDLRGVKACIERFFLKNKLIV